MPKDQEKKKEKKMAQRHQPLAQQMKEDQSLKNRRKQKTRPTPDKDYVESDLTDKILNLAKAHVKEEMEEDMDEETPSTTSAPMPKKNIKFSKIEQDSDEDMSDLEEDYQLEELEEITEEDERALSMFMSDNAAKRVTLADIIMEKIKEKESGVSDQLELADRLASRLDPKVVQAYKTVGELLARYTSGKLPKVVKIIPTLSNWEEILFLTNPEGWSPAGLRSATQVFVSNLNAKMSQRFYSLVLLPRVLLDIKENKKLNFHLYLALKKSLYKPAAFFRGILLPVCESGECSLKAAVILGSVLSKVSIPVLHSSAAILKIAEARYSGANSYFLATLLNKKYALPYRVVDALVQHFTQFENDERRMPVIWHRSLLIFVQRYKTDLTVEQKDGIKALVKNQYHSHFSEEVRRELGNSKCRGEKDTEGQMDVS